MSELDQLYAACIVEHATRQPKGLLAGNFYVFGKDARDAFNLPYDEKIFQNAFNILEEMGVMTVYKRKGVETHYSVRRSDFDNAMIVEGDGRRRHESRRFLNATIAAATGALLTSAAPSAISWSGKREPSLLEAYCDLGRNYLNQVLEAYEPTLAAVGAEPSDDDGDRSDMDDALGEKVATAVPASDRIVLASDNVEKANAAKAAIADLWGHLEDGNDVGDLTVEEVRLAQREISIIQQAIADEAMRVDWVESAAKATLGFIVRKAAGTAAGNLAWKALVAIAAWIGFSI